ncbi:hypothetical protein PVAP13_9NG150246 [Panicum virgatum]|uniref:Uncharacterized protein n=1 Tax=Panicum virgatum TaxID=38727 RepID=A0A8T0MI04_PANVG|nr:hypothetical protein PVAP13_9NG150246 [Panicum virgatum]
MCQVTPASLEAAAGITQGSGGRTQLVTGPTATLAPPQSIASAAPWLLADTDEPPLRPASRHHRSLRATPLAAAAALLGCEGEGGCSGAQEQVRRRLPHASESTAAPARHRIRPSPPPNRAAWSHGLCLGALGRGGVERTWGN